MDSIEIIYKNVKDLYDRQSDLYLNKWNRLIPLNEMVVDRWNKAKKLGFGEGTSIYDNSFVYGNVKIGKNTWIGPFTILDGSGGELVIGDNCSISAGVQIYTHDSVKWALSGGKDEYKKSSTHIGNNCYIGPSSIIQAGITIGSQSVIGALSLVNNDLPDFTIAWGQPAKIVGRVIITDEGGIEFEYDEK